ncbi:MAG TPA: efflux RND transporter periplasmic adaptor subunit [Syntrophobacteraceae bacterium]|nr:efflux RND transporter periplasmic adaptor subunit [Syntrophobacteraceae bacterium]
MKIKSALWIALAVAGVMLAVLAFRSYGPSGLLLAAQGEKAGSHAGHDEPGAKARAESAHPEEQADAHAGHGGEKAKGKHKEDTSSSAKAGGHADEEKAAGAQKDSHGDEVEEKAIRLSEAQIKEFGIEVSAAGSGELQNFISLPGEVVLNEDRKAHIVPRIAGVVREVRKTLGDTVKQGEVMAVIESRELADAKAEYLAAQEKTSLAQASYRREEGLWKKKISSQQEYLDAKQALAEAQIALRSAEQKLFALGLSRDHLKQVPQHADSSLTRFEIMAPFPSTVIEKHISLGEMLKEDAECFLVADMTTVWVNINIYQKDIASIRKGQRVLISLGQDGGGQEAEGQIAYVEPIVKEETRTARARVILPNPQGNWRPGMFVTAKVAVDSASAPIVVPSSALQTVEEKQVVFVQRAEGFEARPVVVGRATNGDVEIASGLSAGEKYVSKGTFTLKAQLSKGAFGDGHNH